MWQRGMAPESVKSAPFPDPRKGAYTPPLTVWPHCLGASYQARCNKKGSTTPREILRRVAGVQPQAESARSAELTLCCMRRMGAVVPFSVVEGPEAWKAADYQNQAEHIYVFTKDDIAELDAAIASVQARKLDVKVKHL